MMASITLTVNGEEHRIEADPETPLLWILRDKIGLTGTKFGCGIAQCGSCLVHVDGNAVHSCTTPVKSVAGREITTIEGLSAGNDHPVQRAWIDEQVPQCGYCQSGQIMAAAALLKRNPHPGDEEINAAMQGVLCRCGTYPRIKKAIRKAISYQTRK